MRLEHVLAKQGGPSEILIPTLIFVTVVPALFISLASSPSVALECFLLLSNLFVPFKVRFCMEPQDYEDWHWSSLYISSTPIACCRLERFVLQRYSILPVVCLYSSLVLGMGKRLQFKGVWTGVLYTVSSNGFQRKEGLQSEKLSPVCRQIGVSLNNITINYSINLKRITHCQNSNKINPACIFSTSSGRNLYLLQPIMDKRNIQWIQFAKLMTACYW